MPAGRQPVPAPDRGGQRRLRPARPGPARPAHGELLEAVGLAGLGKRYPHQLSGGQQQRVALARALAIEPALVLLDEPFASLDAHMRASIRTDVQPIFRSAGTTAILVTHDQDEALSMADRVAVLRDGRIVQYAAPQDLYIRPADPQLASFIGDANLLDGQLRRAAGCTRSLADLRAGRGRGPGAGPVTVLVRPEQLEVRERAGANGNGAGDRVGAGLPGGSWPASTTGTTPCLRVQPEAGRIHGIPVPEIIVRTAGGPSLPPGADVLVRARGPVLAWPRG